MLDIEFEENRRARKKTLGPLWCVCLRPQKSGTSASGMHRHFEYCETSRIPPNSCAQRLATRRPIPGVQDEQRVGIPMMEVAERL